MKSDSPIVEEVRERRMKISVQFGHDLEKYLTHLRDIERKNLQRVVNQVTVVRANSGPEDAPTKK